MIKILTLAMTVIILLTIVIEGTAFAERISDNADLVLNFTKPFQRIISLYGAHSENLFYLGADIQIIGVSVNDTYPEQVYTISGSSYHDDAKKFLLADPELIIIRSMIDKGYNKLFSRLEKLGTAVVSLQPSNTEEMYHYCLNLGSLTGKSKQAKKMVHDFKTQIIYISSLNLNTKKNGLF